MNDRLLSSDGHPGMRDWGVREVFNTNTRLLDENGCHLQEKNLQNWPPLLQVSNRNPVKPRLLTTGARHLRGKKKYFVESKTFTLLIERVVWGGYKIMSQEPFFQLAAWKGRLNINHHNEVVWTFCRTQGKAYSVQHKQEQAFVFNLQLIPINKVKFRSFFSRSQIWPNVFLLHFLRQYKNNLWITCFVITEACIEYVSLPSPPTPVTFPRLPFLTHTSFGFALWPELKRGHLCDPGFRSTMCLLTLKRFILRSCWARSIHEFLVTPGFDLVRLDLIKTKKQQTDPLLASIVVLREFYCSFP